MKKEIKKLDNGKSFFSVIFLILNVIIGLFSFLVAMTGFSIGKTLFGFLYFALGIFCFIPKKIVRIPNWNKFIIAVTVSLILLIMSISLNWDLSTPPVWVSHNLNEVFIFEGKVANISVVVNNISKEFLMILNGEETTTEGYFLIVDCDFVNLGTGTITLTPTYYLMDGLNKTYAGIAFTGYQQYFQPDLKKQDYFIFELPLSAKELKLYLQDVSKTHIIDLGI